MPETAYNSGMRTVPITLGVLASFVSGWAQDPPHIDVQNLFPNVGAVIVWAEPNNAGVPPGVLGACSGTLIDDRIFLTAAHCTRPSEGGLPPFIRVFVTFNLHVFDDRSTWIRVIAQAWHPSTLPCPNQACNWPPPPTPHYSDVGLMLLATPVKFVKPAKLAPVGLLDRDRGDRGNQIIVGYGFLNSTPEGKRPPLSQWDGIRHYRVIAPEQPFDDRQAIGGLGENCFIDSGGPTFRGPVGESGEKRRAIVATTSGWFEGNTCATGRSVVSRIDNEEVQSWIARQIEHFLASNP